MNLFVVGWNLPEELSSVALAELGQMTEVYPQLDPETIWHFGNGDGVFAASMHTATQAAAPRCYVGQSEDQVTLYDGCPVDRTGGFPAHDAEALSSHWDQLSKVLEGQFVVVRVADSPPCIELLTDFLGMEQVYYLHQRNMWLVSNSVRLISRIIEASAWDPLGVSLFLTVGWAGADRTLRRDVRVIPGGQHWKWRHGDVGPRQDAYYPRSILSSKRSGPRRRRVPLPRSDVQQLADELIAMCRHLAQSFGELECTLSGGRDSRLVASLLVSGRIPASYYTGGEPSSADVQIATRIAKAFDLPHRVNTITTTDVVRAWEPACRQLIQQTDGMVSLWQIADVLKDSSNTSRLSIELWGICGAGQEYYGHPKLFLLRYGLDAMQGYLVQQFVKDHGGLIRRDAMELARSYLNSFVEQVVDDGFPPLDALEVFNAYEDVRRWAGANARKATPVCDLFAPLCTRPFVEAAFSLSAWQRYTQPLHQGLIRLLVPELHSVPLDKDPWPSQQPLVNIARWVAGWPLRRVPSHIQSRFARQGPQKAEQTQTFDQAAWLETMRSSLRELCLDQGDSLLWNFVNRSVFERIMSHAADPAERHRRVYGLYSVATLFHYALT